MEVARDKTLIRTLRLEDFAKVTLYENNLAEVNWLDRGGTVIQVEELKEVRDKLGELSKGQKLGVFTTVHPFADLSNEAKKYGGTVEANQFTYANAVLVDNLAKKILWNLFLKVSRPVPVVPYKAFTNKKDAFDWLIDIQP